MAGGWDHSTAHDVNPGDAADLAVPVKDSPARLVGAGDVADRLR